MAVNDPTTNYGYDLPNTGGDSGVWGTRLREILGDSVTGLDAIVFAISTVANAALAKAGGSMTGEIDVLTERFLGVNKGNMTGVVSLDLDAGNVFWGTVTGTVTLSFANVPTSGDAVFWTLEITNGGSQTINWPAAVSWPGGSPPTLTTSGIDIVTFYTRDGGTNVYAAVSMLNLS